MKKFYLQRFGLENGVDTMFLRLRYESFVFFVGELFFVGESFVFFVGESFVIFVGESFVFFVGESFVFVGELFRGREALALDS